jgi:hypothetical protein
MLSPLGAIFNERLEYKSETAADTLKKEMESVFLRTKGLHFRPNLSGAFSSGDEFIAYPKIEIGSALAGGRTTLTGKITPDSSNSIVSVVLRPNPLIKILFWFFLFLGSVFCADFFFVSHKQSSREVGFYFAVIAPLFLFCLSFLTKTMLRFSFTHTFGLTRAKTHG